MIVTPQECISKNNDRSDKFLFGTNRSNQHNFCSLIQHFKLFQRKPNISGDSQQFFEENPEDSEMLMIPPSLAAQKTKGIILWSNVHDTFLWYYVIN